MNVDFKTYSVSFSFILLVFVECVFAQPSMFPNPDFGQFYVAPRLNVTIDGNLREWRPFMPVVLNTPEQASYKNQDWRGPADCSVRFWIAWNAEGFLVAAETVDDSASFPYAGHDGWANDCIQFCVDVHDDNDQNFYANDDHEFVVTLNDSVPLVYEHSYSELQESGYRDYPCQMLVRGDTIRYEALIPWSGLGLLGSFAGMHVGASVVAFDNDGANFRGWLEWTAGIAEKKFTLPFANVLFFDENANIVQAIPAQSFLSENDSLVLWTYSRYYRRSISYRLFEADETLFRNKVTMRAKKWTRLPIAPKYLKSGKLKLEITSAKISHQFDIAVWSKDRIAEQISYLVQQASVLKNLKGIDSSVNDLMKYWADWLQQKFAHAGTDFEFFDVMNQAQKRIDQIPNFFMNQQVFYHREFRIVEQMYESGNEAAMRRYLLHLPTVFNPKEKYPAFVFLHDVQDDEEESARKIGEILTEMDLNMIGIFPKGYPHFVLSPVLLEEITLCIRDAVKKYPINQEKIYIAGEGIGGAAALLLAQRAPDKFAAVTLVECNMDTAAITRNAILTPIRIVGDPQHQAQCQGLADKIKRHRGSATIDMLPDLDIRNAREVFSPSYFRWLLAQRKSTRPRKIDIEIDQLQPSNVAWLDVIAQRSYRELASVDAVVDSGRIIVATHNIRSFSIQADPLPLIARFPLHVLIDGSAPILIQEKAPVLSFLQSGKNWELTHDAVHAHQKSPQRIGPMSKIFTGPIKFVYSTAHDSDDYNRLTHKIAREAGRRGPNAFLEKMVVADSAQANAPINSHLFIVGNVSGNALLKKIADALPMVDSDQGLRFGDSYFFGEDKAAFFIYPNPLNSNYLMMVCLAPALSGLKNIERVFDLSYYNQIYRYDYVIIGDSASPTDRQHWLDFGHFDEGWGTNWFQPRLRKGPKNWLVNMLVGMDANQLSINSNWSGGGKGSFTWKIYSRMEFENKKKIYNWKNMLYCAYGQISVQEKEQWTIPEKSNDVIDFDSELKFTLERFIDPYVAFAFDTQFSAGYNPKTRELVSRFLNPVKLSQSAGIAKSISKNKKFQLTTRLGYGAKEVVAGEVALRKLWTGDETKWMKIDGGVEWLTEFKSEFNANITLTNKLKLFQAVFSSISEDKDPDRNWQQLDLYWEQMFTARLTQYVLFNVVVKLMYDRDTSKGGQFLENASLGVSYKFKGIAL
ncbi:MAG: DUF3078 domain-containing protein [Candidatus Zhuqueibacterota bacterium]